MHMQDLSDYASDDEQAGRTHNGAGRPAAPVKGMNVSLRENQHVYASLKLAQLAAAQPPDEIISDAPPHADAMTLRSQNLQSACKRLLGPAFQQAYAHCKARYADPCVDMAAVRQELVEMVDTVPLEEVKNTIGQLEMMVFNEIHRS
jgi:hypothetical protein